MQSPVLSVIMPVYNCEAFVAEAMESILGQTFTDFELIVIDDASTDRTAELVNSYGDERLVFVQKPVNTGYTVSLNMGLQMARGEFIARMDGDDVCRPTRFEKQVARLKSNPELGLVGSRFAIIGNLPPRYSPLTHDAIKVYFLHHNYLQHPTAMMRKAVLDRHGLRYDPAFEPAEDYRLWSEIVKWAKVEVIDEELLDYRMHQDQTSVLRAAVQEQKVDAIRLLMLVPLLEGDTVTEEEKSLHLQLIKNEARSNIRLKEIDRWIERLLAANATNGTFNQQELAAFLRSKQQVFVRNFYQYSSRDSLENITYFFRNFRKLRTEIFSSNYMEIVLRIFYRNSLKRLLGSGSRIT